MHCILHIGTEKTGTTSLQHLFTTSMLSLMRNGVLYPVSLSNAHAYIIRSQVVHTPLAVLALDEDDIQDIHNMSGIPLNEDVPAFRRRVRRDMDAEVASFSGGRALFSSEHLSSRLTRQEHVQRLKSFLDQWFDSYTIVIYLRHQLDLYASTQSTDVISGHPRDIPDMQDQVYGTIPRYDYRQLIDLWGGVFGRKSLCLREFDSGTLPGGDICRDFATALDLECLRDKPSIRVNESLGLLGFSMLNSSNPSFPPRRECVFNAVKIKLNNVVLGLKLEDGPIPRYISRELLSLFQSINQEISDEFFGGRRLFANSKVRLSEERPISETPCSTEDLVNVFAHATYALHVSHLLERQALTPQDDMEQLRQDLREAGNLSVFCADNPLLLHHMGKLLLSLGDAEGAAKTCRQVLDMERTTTLHHRFYHHTLAQALAARGDLPGAIEHAGQAILLNEMHPEWHEFLAKLLEQVGDHEGAGQARTDALLARSLTDRLEAMAITHPSFKPRATRLFH